ncbi:phospholipase effector Tle1 domain-containing protein, partial [Pantoea brenneri]
LCHGMVCVVGRMRDLILQLSKSSIYSTKPGLIKNCVHLVSSHEQRLCFPLDSLRRANGKYPANSKEMVYSGMHSDIGGGYPPGDQGKANASHDGNLLSQIVLHELYSVAFSAGAPLKVPGNVLGADLRKNVWRIMDIERMNEFAIAPDLVNRFNAWRELTLNLPPSKEKITDEQAVEYIPPRAPVSLEKAFENQIAWITAWRIDRYAKGTMLTTPFYERAKDSDALTGALESSEAKRELQQGAVRARRQEKIASQPADKMDELVLEAGVKDFDPDIAKTQLKQAAKEFGEDYRQQFRSPTSIGQLVLAVIPRNSIFLLNIDDGPREYALIKASAETKVATLFPPPGEASNADTPAGLVRALFDDQVHDSRAWFMQYTLGTREPWGGYFLYRMIYFSNKCNKSLSPLTIAGDVVGAATLVGGVIFSFKQKGTTAKLAGLAGTAGLLTLESEAMDYLTGLAIPMVDNADVLKAFTSEPGVVTAQQREIISEKRLEMAKSIIQSGWLEKAQSLVTT